MFNNHKRYEKKFLSPQEAEKVVNEVQEIVKNMRIKPMISLKNKTYEWDYFTMQNKVVEQNVNVVIMYYFEDETSVIEKLDEFFQKAS